MIADLRNPMVHLIKLSVGTESVESLRAYIEWRGRQLATAGRKVVHVHTTRMTPKRRDELLDGGSIYWVIKGQIQARQKLVDIEPFTDADGIGRCNIVMDPELVATRWQPKRPFQGWRYLKRQDAPSDLKDGEEQVDPELAHELSALGLM